jgi:two-component system OmpR family sensor kinase
MTRRGSRQEGPPRGPFRSLGNRLALVFFAITLLAIGTLYLYVAPGLRARLVAQRLTELRGEAERELGPLSLSAAGGSSGAQLRRAVNAASIASGARVTLLEIDRRAGPIGPRLRPLVDSSNPQSSSVLGYPAAWRALRIGRPVTATESTRSGQVAEAAVLLPRRLARPARVVVFSAPIGDIESSVSLVRHQILIAGGIALLLALTGGYLIARWLAARVKRLEHAAERIAGGEFGEPLRIDSGDELGQLARTFNLMQRQLAQLETARKQFIAVASHELRTPVFSLGGFVELLEDEELDAPTRRRFLGHVSEQVERLRKLSVDLLDLSRLEAGSLELRPEPTDLAELTRSVSAEFEVSLRQHDCDLELRLAPRVEALCDPVRLAQIVRILIDNAVTHTPPGTRIVVTTAREDGRVRVAVRDTGTGIDEAALPRIFEPFFTADDAQGSGLGLAIASELAERMDGRLRVEAAPGHTVFTLELPA